jgi:hypothetical protein
MYAVPLGMFVNVTFCSTICCGVDGGGEGFADGVEGTVDVGVVLEMGVSAPAVLVRGAEFAEEERGSTVAEEALVALFDWDKPEAPSPVPVAAPVLPAPLESAGAFCMGPEEVGAVLAEADIVDVADEVVVTAKSVTDEVADVTFALVVTAKSVR